MNRLDHLMTIAMEECDEVSQRISKAKRFGLQQVQQAKGDKPEQNPDRLSNLERIQLEFYDLVAVLEMAGLITTSGNAEWTFVVVPTPELLAKQAKVEHYLKMSREHGRLED